MVLYLELQTPVKPVQPKGLGLRGWSYHQKRSHSSFFVGHHQDPGSWSVNLDVNSSSPCSIICGSVPPSLSLPQVHSVQTCGKLPMEPARDYSQTRGFKQKEARGLDAGPRLVQKLMGFGDHRSAKIVAKIAEEEVAHVAVGVFWFLAICERMDRTPCATFQGLLKEFNVEPKGPFNYLARDEAGIPREWYDPMSSGSTPDLSKVHDRLSHIIAMEKANSSLRD
ncbi:hypothetical protein Taro_001670 [Colocasia esculenta]|uniref:Uncharacterized protein n=1 Tax=Colocasia esculenta TaxID=4460 RepID=A0A843TGW6_COLES|nr:hypothetical protein [Colocasia esculenta]